MLSISEKLSLIIQSPCRFRVRDQFVNNFGTASEALPNSDWEERD